jgi:osmoprotectant transport system permease protein
MNEVLTWLTSDATWQGSTGIPNRMLEHIAIAAVSVLVATVIALPIGLWIGHTGRASTLAVNVANIGRAIPSYALIVIVLPLSLGFSREYGLNLIPTFLAMVVLAIPPILVNAFAGVREVDRDLVEAARGMGLRERQILSRVEVPLAAPVIMGGFRTSVLNVIATATIGAVLGFGGLGRFILDGRAKGIAGTGELIGGALIVAVLAVVVDLLLAFVQRLLQRRADPQLPEVHGFSELAEVPVNPNVTGPAGAGRAR